MRVGCFLLECVIPALPCWHVFILSPPPPRSFMWLHFKTHPATDVSDAPCVAQWRLRVPVNSVRGRAPAVLDSHFISF